MESGTQPWFTGYHIRYVQLMLLTMLVAVAFARHIVLDWNDRKRG